MPFNLILPWEYDATTQVHTTTTLNGQEEDISLAIFNFFGTLAWGENGTIKEYRFEKLFPCSQLLTYNFESLINKHYTPCIIEFCSSKKINLLKSCLENFVNIYSLKVHIFIFVYDRCIHDKNKYERITISLFNYFRPKSLLFGLKSFICGHKISKTHEVPWFRKSSEDIILSKKLNFKFYDPITTLGTYDNYLFVYELHDLSITCGQKYSGYEMTYESIYKEVLHKKVKCRIRYTFDNNKIYFIKIKDLTHNIKIDKNEHYVIVGSNPTFQERLDICNKFSKDNNEEIKYLVSWYTKPPYKYSKKYNEYISTFEPPNITSENWVRFN
jgi:hypothetical protein